MKTAAIKTLVLFLLLAVVLGCSKASDNLVGKWKSQKTPEVIEFHSDKTGVIHLGPQPNMPSEVKFKWTMYDDKQFKLEMEVPGAPTGRGKITAKDTIVFEDDVLKKME